MSLLKLGRPLLNPQVRFNADLGPDSDDSLLLEDSARQAQKSMWYDFVVGAVDDGRLLSGGARCQTESLYS